MKASPNPPPPAIPRSDAGHGPARWGGTFRWGMVVLVWSGMAVLAGDESLALEYKVKAGYLFNFAKYIEWPAGAFPSADSPLVVAVVDGQGAGPVLAGVLEGKSVGGHPLKVTTLAAGTPPVGVHILMLTRASQRTPEEARRLLGEAPTLLVGETEDFAERGGVIGFVQEEDRVRFNLCLAHAAEVGLKISAKLSSIAKSVQPRKRR